MISNLYSQDEMAITLKGKSFRPIDTLILVKIYENIKFNTTLIPIEEDSTFIYTLMQKEVEEYELIFLSEFKDNGWRSIRFFTDSTTIEFKLYEMMNFDDNVIIGGDLNKKRKIYERERLSVFRKDYEIRYDLLKNLDRQSDRSIALREEIDSLDKVMIFWQHQYLSKEPDLLGLSEYYKLLKKSEDYDLGNEYYTGIHEFWMGNIAGSEFTKFINDLYLSTKNIIVGGYFYDFKLISDDTLNLMVSDLLPSSKFTLIDLWSPWCRPCLIKSRKVKDKYNLLSEKGMNVISVMGGVKDQENFKIGKERHDYPWQVYSEIDNLQGIWSHYSMAASGGGQILINKEGIILAINPEIEDLIDIMKGD